MDELIKLRKKIDGIDKEISKLLRNRLEIVEKIGKNKTENNIKLKSQKREKEILEQLNTEYEKKIFKKIFTESIKIQKTCN
jgi:chorismate mutase